MDNTIQFELNGKQQEIQVDPGLKLLWVLRNHFGLTGTKFGCGIGFCKACTVMMDNTHVPSCQVPVGQINGKKILTIEGLAQNGSLHPIQEAFMKHDAFQCGFCTPGMIMNAYGFLQKSPSPNHEDIIRAMDNNLCRCGAHVRIVEAVAEAATKMKGGSQS